MALPLSYNIRNLLVRKTSTALTFLVVALVVFILVVLLSFAAGIRSSLATTGSPSNIVVLAPGATAESTSLIFPDEVARLVQTPHVARDESGELLLSPELCVQTNIPRRNGGGEANVAVRGVDDIALKVHRDIRIVEGRWCRQGLPEVVVGRAARDRFEGLDIGGQVILGRSGTRSYSVVGIFDSGGSALESEIWAPRTSLSDSFDRRFVSSVNLTITDPALLSEALDYIKGPVVRLEGKSETAYYDELSTTTVQIVQLTTILVSIMAVGAAFAVANTMYAAVDRRRREIAMLRTIGFSRLAIIQCFVLESVLLCLAACAAGLAASQFLNGRREDFFSDTTFTVMAYELKITPVVLAAAVAASLVVAVLGSIAPALRASRVQVIEALRKA